MRRVMIGFVLGFLVAAGLAGGAVPSKDVLKQLPLFVWKGEGARMGLYYELQVADKQGEYRFYECKPIGPGKVTPPASRP
jgi:hypothetical protein